MNNKILVEKNGFYQIDLSSAKEVVGNLKEEKFDRTIGSGTLSDVDWIAETDEEIFLIEYKNSNVESAISDEKFREKFKSGHFYDSMIKKFYGSEYYILACQKTKPINFIGIIEAKFLDSNLRKRATAKIMKRLPFKFQELPEIKINLINNVKILSIDEWNNQYSMFPLTKVEEKELCLNEP